MKMNLNRRRRSVVKSAKEKSVDNAEDRTKRKIQERKRHQKTRTRRVSAIARKMVEIRKIQTKKKL